MDNITATNMLKMRNMGVNLPDKVYETAVIGLEELEQYRSIGTVSKCWDAVEKQKPKSPHIWGDGYSGGEIVYDMYNCPNCGTGYEIEYEKYNYCPECGQRIDRTELEEMER